MKDSRGVIHGFFMLNTKVIFLVEKQTITDLSPQKKNKERINVYLDGQFAFGLTLMSAVDLRIGQVLTPDEIDSLKSRDEIDRAKTSAYRYLSYRPRSVAEVKKQLSKKGYDFIKSYKFAEAKELFDKILEIDTKIHVGYQNTIQE